MNIRDLLQKKLNVLVVHCNESDYNLKNAAFNQKRK